MPELALWLWLLYGAGALGLRVAVHLRRTGSTGLVGTKSKPFTAMWFAESLHIVALVLGVAAPVLDLTGTLEPIAALDTDGVHYAGLAVYAVGLAGVIAGQAQMGTSWRIGTDPEETTDLVTSGLFRFVRNPIYTAVMLTLTGLALLVPSVIALASAPIFLLAVGIETRRIEEPNLLRVHGKAYEDYAARVGRFLPGVGRLPVC